MFVCMYVCMYVRNVCTQLFHSVPRFLEIIGRNFRNSCNMT